MAKGIGRRQHKAWLDALLDTAHIYVSLHTADPGADGQTANEAIGSGYARADTVPADWGAASLAVPSVALNANTITFATATGDWSSGADFTHAGLWTHLTETGEAYFIGRALLTVAKPVTNGDTVSFAIGALSVQINETA